MADKERKNFFVDAYFMCIDSSGKLAFQFCHLHCDALGSCIKIVGAFYGMTDLGKEELPTYRISEYELLWWSVRPR